ncbi:hypothetical protein [Goodfellowiella coeruleoviolacea]|uniref:Uncharacterized protein n=1 Tax=Goodfellowiella coeruleoviolacea TaxID=334858 RepID=A0AAE3GB16_9PSEU|nr:hypothetical protein [Goodfellowiella coeruleoviolacea]MCP2164996.1 hypothetical protein [Goodfellowiella coeruleoviolacea]
MSAVFPARLLPHAARGQSDRVCHLFLVRPDLDQPPLAEPGLDEPGLGQGSPLAAGAASQVVLTALCGQALKLADAERLGHLRGVLPCLACLVSPRLSETEIPKWLMAPD